MEPNWIQQRAYLTPKRIGLSFGEQSWTFKQIEDKAIQIANQFVHFGIESKSRIAILAPSSPELVFIIYGCMLARIEMVLLNNRLTKEELAYQIQDSNVKAVICHEVDQTKLSSGLNILLIRDLLQDNNNQMKIDSYWNEVDTISIMYTSGTTGYPKGVRQTLQNHKASAINSVLNIGMTPQDVWICMVPIFHISGFSMLMKSLLYGNEIKLYEKFDVEKSVEQIVAGTATHMSVVGVTLGRIIDYMEQHHLKAHSNFRLMLAGGSSIPVDYLKRAQKLALNVAQTYGMTETSSQTATLSSEDALFKIGSAGKPLFFNSIKIDGAKLPNEEGEICIRGPHVTPGYIGRFEATASVENGWLKSGDIGYLDEDGYLFVVDRRSDLIISGGENIYPAEIENILLMHPSIEEAGVCGIDDAIWGQVPIAFVTLKSDVTEQAILEFCKTNLASYKVPKRILFVDQLPRNSSNKLLRRKLKDLIK